MREKLNYLTPSKITYGGESVRFTYTWSHHLKDPFNGASKVISNPSFLSLTVMCWSWNMRVFGQGASLKSFCFFLFLVVAKQLLTTHKMSLPPSLYQTTKLMLSLHLEAWNFVQSLSYDHQGHLPSLGGSPTNPRMVTNQPKDVYYRLGIWHLHFTHKTNTRWQLPWMVTFHP